MKGYYMEKREKIPDEIYKMNKALCKKYPFLIPCDWMGHSMEEDEDWNYAFTWRDDVPFGWLHLFDLMCEELLFAIKDTPYFEIFGFDEVKEKYGELRIYDRGGNDATRRILDKWCFLSGYVCATCGKPEARMTRGYIIPRCFDCWMEFHATDYRDYIKRTSALIYPPVLHIMKWTSTGNKEVAISCEDEYQRLVDDWDKQEEESV